MEVWTHFSHHLSLDIIGKATKGNRQEPCCALCIATCSSALSGQFQSYCFLMVEFGRAFGRSQGNWLSCLCGDVIPTLAPGRVRRFLSTSIHIKLNESTLCWEHLASNSCRCQRIDTASYIFSLGVRNDEIRQEIGSAHAIKLRHIECMYVQASHSVLNPNIRGFLYYFGDIPGYEIGSVDVCTGVLHSSCNPNFTESRIFDLSLCYGYS